MAVEKARAEVGGQVELSSIGAGRTYMVGGPLVPNGRSVSWNMKFVVPLEDGSFDKEIEVSITNNSIESLEVGESGCVGNCRSLLTTTDEWRLDSPEAVAIAMEQGGEGLTPVHVSLAKNAAWESSDPGSPEQHPVWIVDFAPRDTGDPGLMVVIDATTGGVILAKETEWF